MSYQHAMIQVLAVHENVMVAILKNETFVALNCTSIRPKQWDIIDELACTQKGAVNFIDAMSLYLGKNDFNPVPIDRKEFDAIDEAKIALELDIWLGTFKKKLVMTELLPLTMPLKILVDILNARSAYSLPEFDLVRMMEDLIKLSDHLVRQNLSDNGMEIPINSMRFHEHICSAALAAEMGITYYKRMIAAFTHLFTNMVKDRCANLVRG